MEMKRISLIIVTVIIVMACFIGCGKKEPEPGTTIAKGQIDISELIAENKTEENEENSADSPEEPEEQNISYECMDEIREADPESGLVQIDDMLFQYGCKMSEAMEIIERSQSTFGYHDDYVYNENELVLSNGFVNIDFRKGNEFYFRLQAINLTNETILLKDCVVGRIKTEKASKGNVFYAGFNDENSNIVTYNYIKNLMKDYQIIKEATVSEAASHLDIKQIEVLYLIPSEVSSKGNLRVEYVFDSETGELKALCIND